MDGESVEMTWNISKKGQPSKKIPFVPAWTSFMKLPEEQRKELFNTMRAEVISRNLMEKK